VSKVVSVSVGVSLSGTSEKEVLASPVIQRALLLGFADTANVPALAVSISKVGSTALPTTTTTTTKRGYLVDLYCVEKCRGDTNRDSKCAPDGSNVWMEPQNHTLGCSLMDICVDSGFAIVTQPASASASSSSLSSSSTPWSVIMKLDGVGNRMAVQLLEANKTWANSNGNVHIPLFVEWQGMMWQEAESEQILTDSIKWSKTVAEVKDAAKEATTKDGAKGKEGWVYINEGARKGWYHAATKKFMADGDKQTGSKISSKARQRNLAAADDDDLDVEFQVDVNKVVRIRNANNNNNNPVDAAAVTAMAATLVSNMKTEMAKPTFKAAAAAAIASKAKELGVKNFKPKVMEITEPMVVKVDKVGANEGTRKEGDAEDEKSGGRADWWIAVYVAIGLAGIAVVVLVFWLGVSHGQGRVKPFKICVRNDANDANEATSIPYGVEVEKRAVKNQQLEAALSNDSTGGPPAPVEGTLVN